MSAQLSLHNFSYILISFKFFSQLNDMVSDFSKAELQHAFSLELWDQFGRVPERVNTFSH